MLHRNLKILKFLLYYFLYLSLLSILFFFTPIDTWSTLLSIELTKYSIEVIGIQAEIQGNSFKLDNITMLIEPECNGLKATLLFLAVIMAYPAKLKLKLTWMISSIFILQVLNILRITFLAWILRFHLNYFDFIHEYLSPIVLISISLYLFYYYTKVANLSLHSQN